LSFASEQPSVVISQSQANSRSSGSLQFPLSLGAHSIVLAFKKYVFVRPGDPGPQGTQLIPQLGGTGRQTSAPPRPVGTGFDVIRLPIPSNIQDTYSIRVQGGELGIGGSEVATGVSAFSGGQDISINNLLGSLRQALPDLNLESIINPNMSEASRNLAFLGRRAIDNTLPGASRAIDAGLGNTINPKAALFFEGVNLKQFDFRWNLAPTERAESDALKNVINTIRKNALPTYGNAIGLNRVLLNYPSTVDIYFQGINQEYFLFFKRCMIQQFETNYTPNGLAFVAGGKPSMVSMGITLMEMDIHTSEDYGGESRNFNGGAISPGDPTTTGAQ